MPALPMPLPMMPVPKSLVLPMPVPKSLVLPMPVRQMPQRHYTERQQPVLPIVWRRMLVRRMQ
jgi:hypothetical protein